MFDCGSLIEAGQNGAILFDWAFNAIGPGFVGLFAFASLAFVIRQIV